MNYPKAVMTVSELEKMGFRADELRNIYRIRGQTICWKKNPTSSNSPLQFDTEELEKYRKRKCAL